MLAGFVALAIATTREQTWWDATSNRLRGVASTCSKWGINFSAEGAKEFETDDSPVPGRLEITGEFDGPDELKIGISTMVGLKQALAVKFGSAFTMTPEGNTKEASGALYVEGLGLAAKMKEAVGEAMTFKGSAENALAKISISSGRPDESPVAFTVHLGPLDVNIDPVKYAKRLRAIGPELAKTVAAKVIGGVSLTVDGEAMVAALAHAPEPPPGYYQTRTAVSLKKLIAAKSTTVDQLTSIDGVVFDDHLHDVFLVGGRSSSLPAVPTERVATVARAVYAAGLQPFISLDPHYENAELVSNQTRVGGIPEDVKDSSLILTMLNADYAMKRLFLGDKKLPGFSSMVDISAAHNAALRGASRFWINPAPLRDGDVCVSRGHDRVLYSMTTRPIILTAPYSVSKVAGKLSPDGGDAIDSVTHAMTTEEANQLTDKFALVEAEWPESGFAQVRQDLELTNLFSLLRTVDVPAWAKAMLAQLASLPVPHVTIRPAYALIQSATFKANGAPTVYQGGVCSAVNIPPPTARSDGATSADYRDGDGTVSLGPLDPVATGPTPIPANDVARQLFESATTAYNAGDYEAAVHDARQAYELAPGLADNAYLLLNAETRSKEAITTKGDLDKYLTVLNKAIEASPGAWKLSWMRGYLYWSLYLSGGLDATTSQEIRTIAGDDINRVIQLNPTFADAYAVRAQLEQSDVDSAAAALGDWSTAIQDHGEEAFYYYGRAGAYAEQDKVAVAKVDLDSALALAPNEYHVLLARAFANQKLGNSGAAVADALRATVLAPKDWQCFDVLGQMQYAARRDAAAVRSMTRALALRPPGEEEQAMAKAGKPGYPTFFERLSIWDDFIRFQGKHRDVMSAFSGQGEVVFDPEMVYTRAKAEFRLSRWKAAKADLLAAKPFFGDEGDTISKLVSQCDRHLAGG